MARARRRAGRRRRRSTGYWWEELPQEELLELRLCDLGLKLEGSLVEPRLERLRSEFTRRGLRFKPYSWLSTDWFTPDGLTGFAIPFHLAHRRLMRLELDNMFEVEGSVGSTCLKLMRHEAAHAIDHAYRLHRRKRWREVFGKVSTPYRTSYVPDPGSRDHVMNLEYWYSQSHPLEDFCETFSVWLAPGSQWRKRYAEWPALRKLEYVDEVMGEIADRVPPVRTRQREGSLRTMTLSLRSYYRRKKAAYQLDLPSTYDEPLMRIFSSEKKGERRETAASFLRRMRRDLRRRVGAITGQQQYLVDQVLLELIPRCRKLGLRVSAPRDQTLTDVAILLTFLASHFILGHRPRYTR